MADFTSVIEQTRAGLKVYVDAINELYALKVDSLRKLDLLFVLSTVASNESGLLNNIVALQQKIKQLEDGVVPENLKICIRQCLADLEKNASKEDHDTILTFVDKYWKDKYAEHMNVEPTSGEHVNVEAK